MEISIIIPAYNEESGISTILEELINEPTLSNAEIIVINDGSTDNTAQIVSMFKNIVLLNHTMNRGYGASLITGMRYSTYPHVIWCDSDGQHRVEDILKVSHKLIDDNLDYCIGVRGKQSNIVWSRFLGKFILRLAVSIVARQDVPDYNSGLRGFKKNVIERYFHLFPRGFSASTTSTLIMIERGYVGANVPITVKPRIGNSSVNQIHDGGRTLMTILRIFLLFKPLMFFGTTGFAFILLGLGYGIWRILLNDRGFPVFAVLLVILGFQSLFFGLLADQVSAIRREKFEFSLPPTTDNKDFHIDEASRSSRRYLQ